MIVTTGKIIKIETLDKYYFERSAETPGLVTVRSASVLRNGNEVLSLPANKNDMERFIAAYRRACEEQIDYRESNVE